MDAGKLEFLRGTLDVLILKAVVWGPLHGYAITSFINFVAVYFKPLAQSLPYIGPCISY